MYEQNVLAIVANIILKLRGANSLFLIDRDVSRIEAITQNMFLKVWACSTMSKLEVKAPLVNNHNKKVKI